MKRIVILSLLLTSYVLQAQDDKVDFVSDQAQNQEIYTHFDKPFYVSGETMWFSIYNYRADNHQLIFGRRFMEIALIDRNKQIVKKERIRVVDGKSWGQINLPDYLATGNYLFLVTYPFEDPQNFLYRKVIPVFNPSDPEYADQPERVVTADSPYEQLSEIADQTSKLTISANKVNYSRREPVTVSLILEEQLTGKASVVVRKKGMADLDIRSIAIDPRNENVTSQLSNVQLENFREHKPLNWRLVDSHGLLLYELALTDSAPESSIPYLYIPEDRMTHGIFEARPGQYVFDATGVSGDEKSLYFSSFTFGSWGAQSQGTLKFDWIYRGKNYTNVMPQQLSALPESTPYVNQYVSRHRLRKEIFSSYGSNIITEEVKDDASAGLRYRTAIWKNADDYTEMTSLPEFLKEIVLGMKVWDRRGKYDLRFNYVGGRYAYAPFFLVNGVPTWDVQRVMEIPMRDVFGVGVIKDLQTETGQARDARLELERFGYYGSNGILSVELRPGVVNPFQGEFNELLKRKFYLGAEEFRTPNYTRETVNSPIPDFRPVLYWNPDIVFGTEGQPKISFFASDDAGEYEIIVEGIGKNGEVLFAKQTITIGNSLNH